MKKQRYEEYLIREEKPDTPPDKSEYFTIPNEVFGSGLSAKSFRVYAHIRRVESQEGACVKAIPDIQAVCLLQPWEVQEALHDLKSKGLIDFSYPHGVAFPKYTIKSTHPLYPSEKTA